MTLWRSARKLLTCTVLALAGLAPAQADHLPGPAVAGRLALAEVPERAVPLVGQWGFAWNQFVDPGWQQLPTTALAPVPASWNDLDTGGKPPGADGWGSYVLQLDCPAGSAMAIEAIGQRTAARMFVNGTEVAAHGSPGPSPAQNVAAVYNRTPVSPEFACPLRITLHVANYDHRAGGFVRPIVAGPEQVLARERESRLISHAMLLSAYLFTGFIALIFFAVRRREPVPLLYGLFCLAMAVYTDIGTGERIFLRWLPPQVPWRPFMTAEYLAWTSAMALFTATLRGLFPQQVPRRLVACVLAALGAGAIAAVLLPPGVYSHAAVPGQAIAVLVAGYVAVRILGGQRRNSIDARVLLAGLLAVLATLLLDLLFIESVGPGHKFGPIGFAIFLLSPAVVIGRRLSQALNAEQRAHTLEENARLREDVERMSRHDLKTPLNSILGVTRLLRDDMRLNTEQRELVGVLQRSGFRMLEMVNLSLGLFRMETGTYDFRPQAVDLREVATRVLVDLHSYAEAGGVTLHLEDANPEPVYVRAEELLCYSILANLVKNAVEAAGSGARVTLRLRRGDPVTLTVHNPGEVPADIVGRFFDKYVTSGKSGGTGLGTYSARLMARAQQGDLAMATGAAGTTVTLTLRPLRDEATVPQPLLPARRPEPQWDATRPPREVLLVDDDEYTRLVMRRYLPSPPFVVETAGNGQAAADVMSRRWPHYLLIDMEMPFRSGVDTVRWVREQEATRRRRPCHVLMLSGNDDEASMQRALEAGADRFLVKPVTRELLLSTLWEMETGMSYADSLGHAGEEQSELAPLEGSTMEDEIVMVDPEWIEFFPDFMRSQRETVDAMARALDAGDREDVQFLAHRATGGLGTMGLAWAARQTRAVEREALHAPPEELEQRIRVLREHLRKVRFESSEERQG